MPVLKNHRSSGETLDWRKSYIDPFSMLHEVFKGGLAFSLHELELEACLCYITEKHTYSCKGAKIGHLKYYYMEYTRTVQSRRLEFECLLFVPIPKI